MTGFLCYNRGTEDVPRFFCMKGAKMEIRLIPIGDIIPYSNNPRNNDAAVDAVAASIHEFGFRNPVILDKKNVVVCGHTRLKAAQKLGLDEIPCTYVDDLTDDQIRAFRLVDNKTAEIADWDFDKLEEELAQISMDMTPWGFDEADDDLVTDDGYEEEAPNEPKAKQGDIFILGRHRLMCGDSTVAADVQALMNGEHADCVVTDPPYGVGYKGGVNGDPETDQLENDDLSGEAFDIFLTSAFTNMANAMRDGAAYYVWYASRNPVPFAVALQRTGFRISEQLVWNKKPHVIGHADYHRKHEPCAYGWKGGLNTPAIAEKLAAELKLEPAAVRQALQDVLTDYGTHHEPCMYGWKEGASHYFVNDRTQVTVMDYAKPTANVEHSTMKPIDLMAQLIRNSTKKGWAVLDLFGGSGSTLMACEQTDRKCFMMEFDPKYVDVIINRWETFTGLKAVKV